MGIFYDHCKFFLMKSVYQYKKFIIETAFLQTTFLPKIELEMKKQYGLP